MDVKFNRKITREFNWNLDYIIKNYYFISNVFKLSNFEIDTKWQIVLYVSNDKMFANLHKLKTSDDNYAISLTFFDKSKKIKTIYNGRSFDNSWIYLDSIKENFNLPLKIKLKYEKASISNNRISTCYDPCQTLANYEPFLNSEDFSDFKLICSDGHEIPVHRFVLAPYSELMEKMLMTEARTRIILIEDIDSETMLEVLRYLYAGKVENVQRLGPKLLYCAEKYKLKNLKSFVSNQMTLSIDEDNVLEYLSLADRHDDLFLLDRCAYFIQRNYSSLRDHADWEKVNPKIQCLLSKIISVDEEENLVYVLKTLVYYEYNKLPIGYEHCPSC